MHAAIGACTDRGCGAFAPPHRIRGQLGVPVAEHAEGRPERPLRAFLVERAVDVGDVQQRDLRRERLDLADARGDGAGQREVEVLEREERVVAHRHDDLRGDDRDLLGDPREARRVGERGVGDRALHEQRAVDRERVDLEAPQRLHQRAAGAPVEGDALLDLGGPRRVLEQHDVGLRMARSEHRHQRAARAVLAPLDVACEEVELADRALEVLLTDLVVGRGHRPDQLPRAGGESLRVHQDLRMARRTRRARRARRAPCGVAFVSRNLSACT